ncbi:MAG: ribonuclease H-like domain-containing protein [Acetivibrio sp.]
MLIKHLDFNLVLSEAAQSFFSYKDCLFFDIETNGFSPDISNVYLIGCLYYKEEHWQMTQWFANDYSSEKELLLSFFNFVASFSLLIHYNGSRFDIPYLQKKCIQHHLPDTFHDIQSLDLYKQLSFLKKLLSLENIKQKTLEPYVHFIRKDKYSGGELIKVYTQYMQNRLLSKPCDIYLNALYLHNQEDLLGLFYCCDLLSYCSFFSGEFEIVSSSVKKDLETPGFWKDSFIISVQLKHPVSEKLFLSNDFFQVLASSREAQFKIKLYSGCLKYFYSEYKDYYYLPKEDTAIHKSVAAYVDKGFREKAKASNCYMKKKGLFLPQFKELILPVFREDYKSFPFYFELNDSFLSSPSLQHEYLHHLLLFLNGLTK